MYKKNKILIFSTVIVMVLILIFAFTYAYLGYNAKQEKDNVYKVSCYDVTYDESLEGVTLENAYPVSDEVGLNQTPYTLKLTNNCSYSLNYNIYLNVLEDSTTDDSLLRIGVNGVASDLTSFDVVAPTIKNTKNAYKIMNGSIATNKTIEVNVTSWMSSAVTNDTGENSQFVNKISAEVAIPKN